MSGLAKPLACLVLLLLITRLAPALQDTPLSRKLVPVPFPETSRLDPGVQRQIADSRSALQALLEKSGTTDLQLSEAYGSLGKLYRAYELLEAAAGCFRNAQALASNDFRWPYYLARLYEAEGNWPESVTSLKTALAIRLDDQAAQLGLAAVFLAQDHLDQAEQLFAKVLAADKSSAVALAGLGKCAAARGDFSKAVQHFEAALKLQPDASALHYPLAMAYRRLGDQQKAVDHLSKRGAKEPSGPDPLMDDLRALATGKHQFFERGSRALREGDLAKAAEEYVKMVAADPSDPLAQVELGAVLVRLGNFEAAKKAFLEALRLAPNNPTALYDLGILSTQEGARQEAIRYYRAALNSDPGLKSAHFQLANELVRMGQFQAAAPHYQTVMKLDPRNGFARLMFAVVLARLRQYREALAVLEESHLALPEDMDLATALARLLATSPEINMRNGQRALQLMQQVFKNQQNVDLDQLEVLAMALAEIGSFDKAVEIQQRMISEAERAARPELAAALGETRALYRQRKTARQPWRDDDPIFNPVPGSLGPLTTNRAPAGMRPDGQR